MRNLRVAAVQMESAAGDKEANLARSHRFAEEAAARGVEIVVFPECCITGYWFLRSLSGAAARALAEPVPEGPSSRGSSDLAAKHRMTIGAGLVEAAGDGVFHNTYVVAMPDGRLAATARSTPSSTPPSSRGDEYTVFDTPHGCRVGVLICYDNNIIENVRITALRGAEILLAPHQTGGCRTTQPPPDGPHRPRALGRSRTRTRRRSSGSCGGQGPRLAHALAAEPRPRQRDVPGLQQRRRASTTTKSAPATP